MEKLWIKQYTDGCSPDMQEAPISLGTLLKESAAAFPNSPAIKQDGKTITYKELDALSDKLAGGLKHFGLNKQDKVVIFLPNSKETVISFWGTVKGGYTAVMTNPLYSPFELLRQCVDSDAKAVITYDALLPKLLPIIDKTSIECVFAASPKPEEFKCDNPKVHLINELFAYDYYNCTDIDPVEDIAMLQYTGGTTGISKGCMLTHSNIWSNGKQLIQFVGFVFKTGEEKFAGVLPFFHIYGLQVSLIVTAMLGACILPMLRFTPKGLLSMIQSERITCVPSAPAIFNACIMQKGIDNYDLSSLKLLISGSAPLPIAQIKAFEAKTGCLVYEGYGLSEASPVTHFTNQQHVPGSIGIPIPGTEVKIVDLQTGTKELAPGEEGELCVKGPQVMKGYYKQPQQTAEVLKDGWLYTGDICKYDENGFFFITDRKKDLIITGGYNVYPREVEEALMAHPKVKEACVIGVKNQTRGEIVKAYVVLKDGEELSKPTELIEHCRTMLANYKVPRETEVRQELPKSAVGKVLKHILRDEENLKRAGHIK